MKLSFAVACLLGLVAAEHDPVWSLESVQYHREDQNLQKIYGEHSIAKANARPPYQSHVQIDSKDEPVWKLSSVLGHRTDSGVQKDYGDHSTDKANQRPPYQSHVQLDNKDEVVWQLSSVLGHRTDSGVQKDYGDFSTSQANARPPYRSHVQVDSESDSESSDSDDEQENTNVAIVSDKVIEKNPVYKAWQSIPDGAPDGKYERVITSHFANDDDDSFMRSMIKTYAQEKRTPIEETDAGDKIGGEPTGAFIMGKKDMYLAAKEVLGTHKGLKGKDLSEYLDTYFDRTWDNFDVNGDGAVDVIKSPMFMRMLCSDAAMSLGENH